MKVAEIKPDKVKWTLALGFMQFKTSEEELSVTQYDNDTLATANFKLNRAILPRPWHRFEAWLIPPDGRGAPIRLMCKVRS